MSTLESHRFVLVMLTEYLRSFRQQPLQMCSTSCPVHSCPGCYILHLEILYNCNSYRQPILIFHTPSLSCEFYWIFTETKSNVIFSPLPIEFVLHCAQALFYPFYVFITLFYGVKWWHFPNTATTNRSKYFMVYGRHSDLRFTSFRNKHCKWRTKETNNGNI